VGHACSRSDRLRRLDGGFSLAELLIVMALIGIVSVVAVPVAGKIIRHSSGLGAFANLRQILATARLQAIKRGANVVVEISLTPAPVRQIRLHTFQDRAKDTTSPLPADELAKAGNYQQDTGTFASSPGTDEPTLADITLAPGVFLWKHSGTQNDLGAAAFDGYAGNAALTHRIVFLPSGGIAPPESTSCGLPTSSGGRGIYFADPQGKNFFRVTVESNLSGKIRVDKYVAGSGYVSSGWIWL
jgi:prepilin-type N-terminal cleavage/methylation domain-containing protein